MLLLSFLATLLGIFTLIKTDKDIWNCKTGKEMGTNMALLLPLMLFTGMNGAIVMLYFFTK